MDVAVLSTTTTTTPAPVTEDIPHVDGPVIIRTYSYVITLNAIVHSKSRPSPAHAQPTSSTCSSLSFSKTRLASTVCRHLANTVERLCTEAMSGSDTDNGEWRRMFPNYLC